MPLDPNHLLLQSLHRAHQARKGARDLAAGIEVKETDSEEVRAIKLTMMELAAHAMLLGRAVEDLAHEGIRGRDPPRRPRGLRRFVAALRAAYSAFLQSLKG